jgi:hypothetical protein
MLFFHASKALIIAVIEETNVRERERERERERRERERETVVALV